MYAFSISLTVFEIFRKKRKKNCLKKIVRRQGFQSRLDLGQNPFKMLVLTGNWVSLGEHSRGNISPKLREGGCFLRYFKALYLKNGWRYENEHACIRSSSAPFFFSLLFFLIYSWPLAVLNPKISTWGNFSKGVFFWGGKRKFINSFANIVLTHYRPAMPFGNRNIYFRGTFQLSIVTFKKNIAPLET